MKISSMLQTQMDSGSYQNRNAKGEKIKGGRGKGELVLCSGFVCMYVCVCVHVHVQNQSGGSEIAPSKDDSTLCQPFHVRFTL